MLKHIFLNSLLACMLTLAAYADNKPNPDDWVILPYKCSLCGGKYKENIFNNPNFFKNNSVDLPINIEAQQGSLLDNIIIMQGDVIATKGNSYLKTDHAKLVHNQQKQIETITATGHVDFAEPGFRVLGEFAEFKPLAQTRHIKKANYRLYTKHARGAADEVNTYTSAQQEQKANLNNASYTTCAPEQNTWHLKARKVILNKTSGRGRAQHARLYLFNTPVFYWPYLDFPLDDRRTSGFLFPSFSQSKKHGFEAIVPFYWNMAPNYDSTITWHSYSQRGKGLDLQGRYLQKHWASNLNLEYLYHDKKYKQYIIEKKTNPNAITTQDPRYKGLAGHNRYLVIWQHHGSWDNTAIPGTIGAQFNVNKASDANYLQDFNSDLIASNTQQLLQQALFSHSFDTWHTQVNFQNYQTLHPFDGAVTDSVYRFSPQITSTASFGEDLLITTPIQWTNFTHRHSYYTNLPYTTGQRINFRPALAWQGWQAPGWFIKPRVQLDLTQYDLHLSPDAVRFNKPIAPKRSLPIFDLDSGLIFERNIQFKRPYVQTLEPRLYALWVPFRNQDDIPVFDSGISLFDYNLLYRDNRFSGLDRLGDAKQVTLGLSSRFINANTGSEKAKLEVGEIFYFKNRQVTLCDSKANPNCITNEQPDYKSKFSNLAGLGSLSIRDDITSRANLEFHRKDSRIEKSGFYVHYHPATEEALTAYVGYQYLRHDPNQGIDLFTNSHKPLKQVDTAASLPINIRWRVLGRLQYNLTEKYAHNLLWAIEHQGCCTAIRFGANRNIGTFVNTNNKPYQKHNTKIFLQFVFKGLAGVGHKNLDGYLQSTIPGYKFNR